jgi:hypothetical protein
MNGCGIRAVVTGGADCFVKLFFPSIIVIVLTAERIVDSVRLFMYLLSFGSERFIGDRVLAVPN